MANGWGNGDWSAHVWNGFSRPSGAATFAATRNVSSLDISTPTISDPNTGALTTSQMPAIADTALVNFSLVVGLFLVTMWLESGRKGGIL